MPKKKSKTQRRASLQRALQRLHRDRAKKRASWPTKTMGDGSVWRLHPATLNPVEQLSPPTKPDPKQEHPDEHVRKNS